MPPGMLSGEQELGAAADQGLSSLIQQIKG